MLFYPPFVAASMSAFQPHHSLPLLISLPLQRHLSSNPVSFLAASNLASATLFGPTMKIPTSWAYLVAFASQLPSLARAVPNCPLAGAEFPPPQTLSLHPAWQQALASLKSKFDLIDAGSTFKTDGSLDELSYSIQIFSSNPGGGILTERHRTAPNLLTNTTGVKQVDKDTVYRLGSVSKIYAVVAWLAELGDVHWNQPITNFIPELAAISAQARTRPFDDVRQTNWEEITVAALASQVGGVGRDCR